MRVLIKSVLISAGVLMFLVACDKTKVLPSYRLGTPVTLTATPAALTPTAADSTKSILTLNWTFPNYATDSANMKYVVEVDSAGKNFSVPVTRTLSKALTTSFTGRELNTILLNKNYPVGTAVTLDFRVTSSYLNNNERYLSNVARVTITPFADPSKLTSEKTTVTGTAATSTSHSNTFTWTTAFPGYSGVVNYVIQYDSSGKNFASPKQIAGFGGNTVFSADLNQGDMNTTGLASGIAAGATGKVDYRIKATTAGGGIAYSNTVSVTITTFSPVPANLFITGDATLGGWMVGNGVGVPVPAQQFTKVDAYKFSINLWLNAGKSYLFLPVNGDWSHKYGGVGANGSNNVNGDDFKPEGSDLKSPATDGVYQIVVDFQTNKFTVTSIPVPANLFITGDATPGGWMVGNGVGVPVPSQQFTKLDNVTFGLVVNLTADKSYLFLPVNGDWSHKYGMNGANRTNNVNGDQFKPEGGDMKAPATSGLYLIIVNFATSSWTVTPYTGPSDLFITGDATAGGWMVGNGVGVPVPSQQFTQNVTGIFELTLPLNGDKSFLFLPVNGDWTHKFGGTGGNRTNNVTGDKIKAEGSDLKAPAASASYTITVNFMNMTYKVQ